MKQILEEQNVRLVALSKDTVEEANIQKERDGLTFTLLADPTLEVIRQYGVEHHKALSGTTGRFTIAGLPLVFKASYKSMAIPTSLLIDEAGTIRWVDQFDDFRIRSDNERVLNAIESSFRDPLIASDQT